MKSRSEQGVALVVTLILLSVITFMTVTFLVISRREREGVINRSNQSDASFAADAALEHAKAQFIAQMFVGTNALAFDMMVSTNFINPAGFQPNLSSYTNVNYDHVVGSAAALSQADFLQNLTNLLILPRAPVYITTNKNQQVAEFRYYLDLNRNGRYDTNGWVPVVDSLNQPVQIGGVFVTNYMRGDPEWIGILDHPDRPHSRSNLFVGRYAFIALPVGDSLDINYIHNQAKRLKPAGDSFRRDQGVGSWEINLAAFLYTLNSNTYAWGGTYQYETNGGFNSVGNSFIDAVDILRYRYGGTANNYNSLGSIFSLYGANGVNAVQNNHIDEYLHGPLMTTPFGLQNDPDTAAFTGTPWPGADNTNHFYTSQDLFNADPTMFSFSNRLYSLGTNNSTYDRYTFYNLLSQMGMDSAPDKPGKIHLNYKNINGFSATNFVSWTAMEFFTNAADKMLRAQLNLSITNIPVYDGTNFLYTPAIQRILQLAANIYDASTNHTLPPTAPSTNAVSYPSVFRPIFTNYGSGKIAIVGYREETNQVDYFARPKDLGNINDVKSLKANDNVYGVPYIIGAKKGLPNFNEFSMAAISQFTRRMQITKTASKKPEDWKYDVQYVVGISNVFGVEMWNSYTSSYPRDIRVYVTNELSMRITNDMGLVYPTNLAIGTNFTINANNWPATPAILAANTKLGLVVPLTTNFVFVPDSIYTATPAGFNTNLNAGYPPGVPTDRAPQWGLTVTNRVRVILQDISGRIIDYVQFGGMGDYRHIAQDLQPLPADANNDFKNLWNTNKLTTTPPNLTKGINSQLQISLGANNSSAADWSPYMILPGGYNKNFEIDKFRAFYGLGQLYGGYTSAQLVQIGAASNNLTGQVPFTPTAKIVNYRTWQANDPLVHYMVADLTDLQQSANKPPLIKPGSQTNALPNMRQVNTRYQPWGGNPQNPDDIARDLAYKDPLITRSDDWDFPTNKYPNVGWLGRVHRGTPWQTVYLKSTAVATNRWQQWTGNGFVLDSGMTQPTNDWALLELFTTALNENASRGQLSVNQANLAPWAAILGGVITLTNSFQGELVSVPPPILQFDPLPIDPALHNVALSNIVAGINRSRNTTNYPGQVFQHLGDVLSAPELTVNSPFLNLSAAQKNDGIPDSVYERIPQQTLSLLRLGEPRYVIYSYGQSLKPADKSVIQASGPYFGVPTNYTITGEVVTRSVVRVDNYPTPGPGHTNTQPHVVLESYTVLPPE